MPETVKPEGVAPGVSWLGCGPAPEVTSPVGLQVGR
jgi:hypothetical protein